MKAQRLADAADAKGELEKTEALKAEDEKILMDTKAECHAKSDEYEKNQVTRAEEVKAIEQAIAIMSSPEVSGNAEKHLPQLVQTSGASLLQLRGQSTSDGQSKAAAFLQRRAKLL